MSTIILCGHGSGRPRTIDMVDYLAYRYNQTVTKGGKTWHKGLVAVVRPKALTDGLRAAYKDRYKSILGRNYYSQSLRGYCYKRYSDGNYYSDCSSSQCLTLAKIGLDMPDYNTVGMYESNRFQKILVTIEKGQIKNPELLRVGDQLLFAGSDPSRPLRIGHVEGVYSISEAPQSNTVMEYQRFLNNYYAQIVRSALGALLDIDGDYGQLTRAASVGVFKYMCVKYYGADLTPSNPNFYGATKAAAENVLNSEVRKHPTFGYILNGVLAGLGYDAPFSGSILSQTTDSLVKFQRDHDLPQTGRLSAEVWYNLFN